MTREQHSTPPVHALSYDATQSDSFRPVVTIIAWACIALGACMTASSSADLYPQVHRLLLPGIVHQWREFLGLMLIAACSPVLLVGGILALRLSRIARAWIICGAGLAMCANAVNTGLFIWSDWGAFDHWSISSSVMWLLGSLVLPTSMIALITRPAIRRVFENR
jgi:hypothetical protein